MTGLSPADVATRSGRVTGTTAGAILGLSRWMTPLDAWYRIALNYETPSNDAMEWGLRLQPVVADRFAEGHGVKLLALESRECPLRPWLAASGDYAYLDEGGDTHLVEIKTTTERSASEWGTPGTDGVPLPYLAQVIVQMAVYEARAAHVAVLFRDSARYEEYVIARDLGREAAILALLGDWHARHVVTMTPPEPGSDLERIAEVERLFPQHTGAMRASTAETEEAAMVLRNATRAKKAAEADIEAAKAILCAAIGDAEGIQGDGWKVTWKAPRPATVTDWRQIALAAGVDADLIARHTTTKQAGRRFLTSFEKGAE